MFVPIPRTEEEVWASFCLTIKQPFTSAVIAGEKKWENQRKPLSRYVENETWVFLHSSATPWRAKYQSVEERWTNHPPFRSMKTGMIFGMVRLDNSVHESELSAEQIEDPWITSGDKRNWKWHIGEILIFSTPYEYKRKQGVVESMVKLRTDIPNLAHELLEKISTSI